MADLFITPGPNPRPELLIADHKGTIHRYPVALVIGWNEERFTVAMPGQKNDVYKVALAMDGKTWTCTCPDYVARMKRQKGEKCKHTIALAEHYVGLQYHFFGKELYAEYQEKTSKEPKPLISRQFP